MVQDHAALIVAYARPEGVERLLKRCRESGVTRIYIAIDGPKSETVNSIQSKILKVISDFEAESKLTVKVWRRKANLGAAVSVATAIDWLFAVEPSGYILEDDLVPSVDFFIFAAAGLDEYKSNSKVWMISGSRMNPRIKGATLNDWSHYPMIWGWATWSDKWLAMRQGLSFPKQRSWLHFFDARYNFWYFGSLRANLGLIDAWDVPLAYHQWQSEAYAVIPPVNLVTNVGFDSAATHTSGTSFPLNHPVDPLPLGYTFHDVPDSVSAKNYDLILERILFKVKFKHSFLGVYFRFINFLRHPKLRSTTLAERIAEVKLPTL